MSKTKKHIIKGKASNDREYYENLSTKEIFMSAGFGGKKFKPEAGRGTGISSLGKLVAKNANRSVIKGVRQEGKKEISKELE